MCPHRPPCPPADRPDRGAAHTVACHPEQGWNLLCNGVIVFDDMGEIRPTAGRFLRATRPTTNCLPPRENAGEADRAKTWSVTLIDSIPRRSCYATF